MATPSLQALPQELLLAVTEYLDVPSLSSLHQCNRQFHNLFFSQLWTYARTDREVPDAGTVLIWAAQNGNIPVMTRLLDGPEWPADNENDTTALNEAIIYQNEECVRILLDAGADLTTDGSPDQPPLITATEYLNTAIFRLVLEKSLQALPRNELRHQWSGTFTAAVESESGPILRLLLDHADVFCDGDGKGEITQMLQTRAARKGDCSVIKVLCDYGADPRGDPGMLIDILVDGDHADAIRLFANCGLAQEYERHPMSPLHVAAINGYTKSVSALLAAGFDLEHRGRCKRTPLLDAVHDGHIETTEYLLDSGANIHAKEWDGQNVIDLAVRNDDPHDMVELLLCRGAEINTQPVRRCTPALHWIARWGLVSTLQMLCAAGAPVNLRDLDDQTALHHAARLGQADAIRVLLEAGADPSAMDKEHKTPIHEAAWRLDPTSVQLLLDADAVCNTPDIRGYVPLHVAVQHGSIEICRLILERVDDSEYVGSTRAGQIALQLATKRGHLGVVQLLLDGGINQKDTQLRLPALHEAAAGRHLDILKLLISDNTANPYYVDGYGRTAFDWASTDPEALTIMESQYGKYTPTELVTRQIRLVETVVTIGTSFVNKPEVARLQSTPRVLIRALMYLDDQIAASKLYGREAVDGLQTNEHHKGDCVQCRTMQAQYMCLVCPEVDLCEKCYDRVEEGIAEDDPCLWHEFSRIPREHPSRRYHEDQDRINEAWLEWFKGMVRVYEGELASIRESPTGESGTKKITVN